MQFIGMIMNVNNDDPGVKKNDDHPAQIIRSIGFPSLAGGRKTFGILHYS